MSKFSYGELATSFNQVTQRERIIMFSALLLCSVVIGYFWIIEPASIAQQKIEKNIRSTNQQIMQFDNEIATTEARLREDPLKEANNNIAFTQTTLDQLNKQLDSKLVKFIHAQKMPIALTNVMSKTPGVKITGLTSLPVKEFNAPGKVEDNAKASAFYKHTLRITLKGSYNAIYQYLRNVETLQDKFYWHAFNYKVSDYPLAEVTLEIYTLSDKRDLISG